MQVVITPYYKDLFPDGNDTLADLLAGIDSRLILQLVALMDAELYSKDEGQQTQLNLFNLLLERQSPEVRTAIISNGFRNYTGDSDECDHTISAQADHPFRGKLTRAFRGKLTT